MNNIHLPNFKFSFIVLHYLTTDDTISCINSLIENVINEYIFGSVTIVVVDNGSNNGSYDKIYSKFSKNKFIHFIKSTINLGFASGNNLGFSYAKKTLNADFIILLNNDTLILQKDFLNSIIDIHNSTKFNILGPDILSIHDLSHQNPQRLNGLSMIEIKNSIKSLTIKYYLNLFYLEFIYMFLSKILGVIRKFIFFPKNNKSISWSNESFGVQLHGACLIFDPVYIKKFNGLYSKTFMYAEEDVLFYIAMKLNLVIVYSPKIKVLHKEASSTNFLFTKRLKRKFIYINSRKSLNEIILMINDDNVLLNDIFDKGGL